MHYQIAHPKIKEIVAKNFFTTSQEVERNLSMGMQTLVCSNFFEYCIKQAGSKVVSPMLNFFDEYIGTYPQIGTDYNSLTLEFCTFLSDGSRDGVQLKLVPTPAGYQVQYVQLAGIFGVTTEKVIRAILP